MSILTKPCFPPENLKKGQQDITQIVKEKDPTHQTFLPFEFIDYLISGLLKPLILVKIY